MRLPLRQVRPFRLYKPVALPPTRRWYSDTDKKAEDKLLTSRDSQDINQFEVARQTSKSAPAPMQGLGVELLMKKENKPYVPKLKHQRLSYEYPGLPNEDEFSRHSNAAKQPKVRGRWSRYVPKILTVVVVLWGAYTVKVWVFSGDSDTSKDLLDPEEFHTFKITHKEEIDEDHFLVEVAPTTSHWQYAYYANYNKKSIWNGDRIWLVDVKQPQIMVTRAYTPLPLHFMKSEYTHSGEKKPLLKVINNDGDDYDKNGTMTFYIKRYGDGEVSRYIASKKVGDTLELRGPNVEYKFPYHPLKQFHQRPIFRDLPSKVEAEPFLAKLKKANNIPDVDNVVFYAAGTGIAPILQVLLSRNPYRGHVTVHYSAQKPGELKPLERLIFFLEKLDRVTFIPHYDSDKNYLTKRDIPSPEAPNFISGKRAEALPDDALKLRLEILEGKHEPKEVEDADRSPRFSNAIEQALITSKQPKQNPALALVCGPDGYVDYVAGMRHDATNEQGPVKGLLGAKKWDSTNVYKL